MQADAAACTEQLPGDYPFCIHVYRGWYVCRAGTAGGKAIEFFLLSNLECTRKEALREELKSRSANYSQIGVLS